MAADIRKSCCDYKIGWVAALPLERAAAWLMLDEEHDRPEDFDQPSTDSNSYTWGKLLGHDIVIASLSSGDYGLVPACSTASSLMASFPQIRFILMVGIGAAIPRGVRPDIRLGDVVIGQSVYQYDLGKVKTDSDWENKTHPNKPPQILLRALTKLQADAQTGTTNIVQYLKDGTGKVSSKKRKEYNYPGEQHDRLYLADYTHINGEDCTSCDASNLVQREPRYDAEPEVHAGIIASGNTLVKDARFRDNVTNLIGADCICLEMEAAGLVYDMPCIVIRGICDYADTHKNDRWQQYAAMTAAACAKELMRGVASREVLPYPTALSMMKKDVSQLNAKTDKLVEDTQQAKVKAWLHAPDATVNHNTARELHLQGTGSWFLSSESYTRWKTRSTKALWLHGIPGCGKTILASTIIADLKAVLPEGALLSFFYFDFNDEKKQSLDLMLRSLLLQMHGVNARARQYIEDSLKLHQNGNEQPSLESLKNIIKEVANNVDLMWLVLDALDESRTRPQLLDWLASLNCLNIQILVTSRSEDDIRRSLSEWITRQDTIPIQANPVNKDIQAFVQQTIAHDNDFARWRGNNEACDMIEQRIMAKADGMFRLAACQIDSLRPCLSQLELEETIVTLPQQLDEVYDRLLCGIIPMYRRSAIRLLQFLAYLNRPLRLADAVDIVAVRLGAPIEFKESFRMPNSNELARYCSSLTQIVQSASRETVIRLAHFSVKEYLLSERVHKEFKYYFQETIARAQIAQVSLARVFVLDHKKHDEGSLDKKSLEEDVFDLRSGPSIARFAILAIEHGYVAEIHQKHIVDSYIKLLTIPELFRVWFRCVSDLAWGADPWMEFDSLWPRPRIRRYGWPDFFRAPDPPSGRDLATRKSFALLYACFFGLAKTAERLLELGADVNYSTTDLPPALIFVCSSKYVKGTAMAKLMVDSVSDINVVWRRSTALTTAVRWGKHELIEYLMLQGATLGRTDETGGAPSAIATALHARKCLIVRCLVEAFNVDLSGYGSLLHYVLQDGYVEGVQLLLDLGIDTSAQHPEHGTPLDWAVSEQKLDIVQLLIAGGANVNAASDPVRKNVPGYFRWHGFALHTAVRGKSLGIVRTLLDAGAEMNVVDIQRCTPLLHAMEAKNIETTRLLLSYSAENLIELDQIEVVLGLAIKHGSMHTLFQDCIENVTRVRNGSNTSVHRWLPLAWSSEDWRDEIKVQDVLRNCTSLGLLYHAMRKKNSEMVTNFLAHATGKTASLDDFEAILDYAVVNGSITMAKSCLEYITRFHHSRENSVCPWLPKSWTLNDCKDELQVLKVLRARFSDDPKVTKVLDFRATYYSRRMGAPQSGTLYP